MHDDILITCLLGEASPEQVIEVERWKNADPANEARYRQFQEIWQASKSLPQPAEVNPAASLARFKQKLIERKAKQTKVAPFPGRRLWYVAASVLVALTAGILFYFNRPVNKLIALQTNTNVLTDTLSDGSEVYLNKHSLIKFPQQFERHQRSVDLIKGEAFFEVSHNKSRPFIISTGNTSIRVVGTSFNVKYTNGVVNVIVESGIVCVSNQSQSVLLKRGEKLTISTTKSPFIKQVNTDRLYQYYRTREFVADDTPLWRIVEVLNEAYDVHIIIGRKELNDLPLNTVFKNESLDDILEVISRTFNLTVTRKQGVIILK